MSKTDVGAAHERLRPDGVAHQVVAVERDVERAGRHLVTGDLAQARGDTPRQRHAAFADADERELVDRAVALDDLVRDARQRPLHAVGIHDYRHGGPPSNCGLQIADCRLKIDADCADCAGVQRRASWQTSLRSLGTAFKEPDV